MWRVNDVVISMFQLRNMCARRGISYFVTNDRLFFLSIFFFLLSAFGAQSLEQYSMSYICALCTHILTNWF